MRTIIVCLLLSGCYMVDSEDRPWTRHEAYQIAQSHACSTYDHTNRIWQDELKVGDGEITPTSVTCWSADLRPAPAPKGTRCDALIEWRSRFPPDTEYWNGYKADVNQAIAHWCPPARRPRL